MDAAVTVPAVLHNLTQACSQHSDTLRPAEAQLKEWETRPGFYSSLLLVFSDRGVDTNVRWLSVLYFKNGVDRYWRRNAPNAIAEEEKAQLRNRLLLCIVQCSEPVNQLASQLAVLIGKVARIDCPRQWPELIPALLNAIKTCQEEQHQQRVLAAFYQVVKCMASRRLAHDKKTFEDITQGIFAYVLNIWRHQLSTFEVSFNASNLSLASMSIEYCVLTLKILRKFVIFGYKHPSQHEEPTSFLHMVIVKLQQICDSVVLVSAGEQLALQREKMLLVFSKVLLDMMEFHPTSFVPFIESALAVTYKYCFTDEGSRLIFEALAVNLLNVMKDIVASEEYRPPKASVADDKLMSNPASAVASHMKAHFFTDQVLAEVNRRLVCHYLPLTFADLRLWESDPEHFVTEEGGDSWKFSLRPCAEVLYMTLVKEYRDRLLPQLVQMTKECCAAAAMLVGGGDEIVGDLSVQLRRESVYNAVGLSCFDLYDEIDFNTLLVTTLLAELRVLHPVYRLIRRRVVWLIGKLYGVRLSAALQPVLYDAVEAALRSSEDLVVRLEAAATLRLMVDDFEFDAERFAPRLGPVLDLLYSLLGDVAACDTRLQVLHAISFIVERAGAHIRLHAESLVAHCFEPLWRLSASGDEHGMLRCAVVAALSHLVRGLGAALSACTYPLVLPIVQLAVNLDESAHVYLLDDGLELWETVLHNAADVSEARPADTEALLAMCAAVPRLVRDRPSESLRPCARIVEVYLALDGAATIRLHGRNLADCLIEAARAGGELKPEGLLLVLKVVELFFLWHARESCSLFAELMVTMIGELLGDDGEEETHPAVLGAYAALLARASLHDASTLLAYVAEYARRAHSSSPRSADEVLGDLLLRWIDCLDRTSQPEKRKLSALALASLLTLNSPSVARHLADIVGACVQVLCDVCQISDEGGGRSCVDTLMHHSSPFASPDRDAADTEHDRRKRLLSRTDPVFTWSLSDYVVQTFGALERQEAAGGSFAARLMAVVDPAVLQQLTPFLNAPLMTR